MPVQAKTFKYTFQGACVKELDYILTSGHYVGLALQNWFLVSCFLIRDFENENPGKHHEALGYSEAEEFNKSWDDSFCEFVMVMGGYSYPASEIFLNVDKQAYVNEHKAFTETKK